MSQRIKLISSLGAFCPRRIVRGLLLVFARTPWDVSEHLLYYFVLPPWDDDERVLQRSAFYHLPNILPSVGENGEVTLITPNNFVALPDLDSHMCLVLNESGKLTGTILDGLNETYKCGHHHSDIYRHCPTNFLSCECLENHWSFCADQVGYIWMVTSCPVTDVVAKSQQVQYDPCCPSYKMLQAPVKVFGSVSVAVNQDLYLLGGYFGEPGTDYDVVFSSQILKKRHSEPKLRISFKYCNKRFKTKNFPVWIKKGLNIFSIWRHMERVGRFQMRFLSLVHCDEGAADRMLSC